MKRRWNLRLWAGFLLVVGAFLAYPLVFIRFPATRDVPWATVLMFVAGLAVLASGLRRSYREPALYRGKVAGPILGVLGLLLFAFFWAGLLCFARQLPPSTGAPRVGDRAPDFTLPDQDGNAVSLSGLLSSAGGESVRRGGVLLVFYRGHW